MIQKIKIQGFQSHKDTELTLHPGVNIFLGASDSGKSAIIRAIRWVITNRPSGDSIKSFWGGDTSVELTTDNCTVKRTKGKEEEYMLNNILFKAFRTDVPQEISQALNISDVNLSAQLDSPYLLSLSAGDVAKHFNSVAKLDKIDSGLQNVNSAIRELTNDIKYKTQQADQAKEELKKYEHLQKFESEIEVLEELTTSLTAKQNKHQRLSKITEALFLLADDIEDASEILKIEKPLNDILNKISEKNEKSFKVIQLGNALEHISDTQRELDELSYTMKLEVPVTALLSLYGQRKELAERGNAIWRVLSNIKTVTDKIQYESENAELLHKQFEKEMGDVCILCGTKLK